MQDLTTLKSSRRRISSSSPFALLLFAFLISSAAAQRRERAVDTWRPSHYEVAISLNDQLTEISSARTEISLEVLKPNTTTIDLDFGEMAIDSVWVSGSAARFERQPDQLIVTLPHAAQRGEKLSLTVTYHGKPNDGLVFAKDRDGKAAATGDNWPNRVHQWIPCFDHPSAKATVSFTVIAPARETVVANGRFVAMNAVIPAYCMVISVGEGARIDASETAVTPLSYYVPRKDAAYAPKGFSPAAPAVAFFSHTVAPYPYEKLALIIGATRFGGMENSSAIVFPSTLFDLRPNDRMSAHFDIPARIESVVAHEIAHQWFGDSVTEQTWADLWLSEGFATYFAGLFIQKHEDEAAFREYMQDAATRYFAFEKLHNTPIHDTQTKDLMGLLNPNNYEKGAWVLHMLRRRLGDEAFFKGLRDYYNDHRDANATTEDLRQALEKSSSKNLKEFFARWIYGTGHPVYEWSSATRGNSLTITLKQTQSGEPFLDPVPIEITSGAKTQRTTIQPKGKLASIGVRTKGQPASIRIDPEGTLLKELTAR